MSKRLTFCYNRIVESRIANIITSTLVEKGVGKNQMPMLTVPFLDWLNSYDWSDYAFIEFGSGLSTNYFSDLFKYVESIETEYEWHEKINNNKKNNINCYYILREDIEHGNYFIDIKDKTVVLIDSNTHRFLTVKVLLTKIKPEIIIFDNIEWYPNASKYLINFGYNEIPFWGIKTEIEEEPNPSVDVLMEKCTSVFIKNTIELPNRNYNFFSKGSHIMKNYPLDQI